MLSSPFLALYNFIVSVFTENIPNSEVYSYVESWSALLAMFATGFVFVLPVILIVKLVSRFIV